MPGAPLMMALQAMERCLYSNDYPMLTCKKVKFPETVSKAYNANYCGKPHKK
jgi:hypothetical protein